MLDRWIEWLEIERGMLPNTTRAYRRELQNLARTYDEYPVEELTTEDLRDYIIDAGGKPGTINKRISALASYYGWLVRTDRRLDDPTRKLDRPKARRGLPRPVDNLPGLVDQMDVETRWIVSLLVETGMRISEACAIRSPVPAPDVLRVRGKGSKERLVPLTDTARNALDRLGGRIPIKPRAVQRRFQKHGFSPHQLRHTYACDLAEHGADLGDIQELLGHESPATTKVYARFNLDRLRRAQALRLVSSRAEKAV